MDTHGLPSRHPTLAFPVARFGRAVPWWIGLVMLVGCRSEPSAEPVPAESAAPSVVAPEPGSSPTPNNASTGSAITPAGAAPAGALPGAGPSDPRPTGKKGKLNPTDIPVKMQ